MLSDWGKFLYELSIENQASKRIIYFVSKGDKENDRYAQLSSFIIYCTSITCHIQILESYESA